MLIFAFCVCMMLLAFNAGYSKSEASHSRFPSVLTRQKASNDLLGIGAGATVIEANAKDTKDTNHKRSFKSPPPPAIPSYLVDAGMKPVRLEPNPNPQVDNSIKTNKMRIPDKKRADYSTFLNERRGTDMAVPVPVPGSNKEGVGRAEGIRDNDLVNESFARFRTKLTSTTSTTKTLPPPLPPPPPTTTTTKPEHPQAINPLYPASLPLKFPLSDNKLLQPNARLVRGHGFVSLFSGNEYDGRLCRHLAAFKGSKGSKDEEEEGDGSPAADSKGSSSDSSSNSSGELPNIVTLLTHTTPNRSYLIKDTCQRFTGPVITVIYYHPIDERGILEIQAGSGGGEIRAAYDRYLPTTEECPNLEVLLYPVPNYTLDNSVTTGKHYVQSYPVNTLRNTLLLNLKTSHYLMIDIDFTPSKFLRSLANVISWSDGMRGCSGLTVGGQDQDQGDVEGGDVDANFVANSTFSDVNRHDNVYVIPAFETTNFACDYETSPASCLSNRKRAIAEGDGTEGFGVPSTFNELVQCGKRGKCSVFDSVWNPDGHSTTNSRAWVASGGGRKGGGGREAWEALSDSSSDSEQIVNQSKDGNENTLRPARRVKCFDTSRYEPYLLMRFIPNYTPLYDERFTGYGKNKISHVTHLRVMGFRFYIQGGDYASSSLENNSLKNENGDNDNGSWVGKSGGLGTEGFLIHNPHPESSAKNLWMGRERVSSSQKESMLSLIKSDTIEKNPDIEQTDARAFKKLIMNTLYTEFTRDIRAMYQHVKLHQGKNDIVSTNVCLRTANQGRTGRKELDFKNLFK